MKSDATIAYRVDSIEFISGDKLKFNNGFNVIIGENGIGKTNILNKIKGQRNVNEYINKQIVNLNRPNINNSDGSIFSMVSTDASRNYGFAGTDSSSPRNNESFATSALISRLIKELIDEIISKGSKANRTNFSKTNRLQNIEKDMESLFENVSYTEISENTLFFRNKNYNSEKFKANQLSDGEKEILSWILLLNSDKIRLNSIIIDEFETHLHPNTIGKLILY